MKSHLRRHHYFLSPHRDDAWLTFGGKILTLLKSGEDVTICILFGTDAYLRPQFVAELANEGTAQKHIHSLLTSAHLGPDQKEKLRNAVTAFHTSQDKTATEQVGIAVRESEECCISKMTGVSLLSFDLPCAFPNRGYRAFNCPVDDSDSALHISILENRLPLMKTQDMIYVVSGIGGHPDHIITARLGEKYGEAGLNVRFGMDFPYSSVLEWIQKTELQFDDLQKEYTDITAVLDEKVRLLSQYASQLGPEDLRLAKQFPTIVRSLYRTDFPDSPQDLSKWHAVEAMYSFRK